MPKFILAEELPDKSILYQFIEKDSELLKQTSLSEKELNSNEVFLILKNFSQRTLFLFRLGVFVKRCLRFSRSVITLFQRFAFFALVFLFFRFLELVTREYILIIFAAVQTTELNARFREFFSKVLLKMFPKYVFPG